MTEMVNLTWPYVEKNTSRHKTVRYYLRIDGKRVCRLPDDPSSEEFAEAYWKARNASGKALEREEHPPRLSLVVKPNSFRWLCVSYMASVEFSKLDDTTQVRRRAIIDSMCMEPLTPKPDERRIFADVPLLSFNAGHVTALRDRKKDAPFAADERLKVLRQIFETKGPDGKPIAANVAKMVAPFRQHTDGHHTITPVELEQYIAHHGPTSKATLAIAMMMFTGFRVSDLALIGPQHRRGDAFSLRLFKNRNRTPVDLVIAIHPILEAVLASHQVKGMTYLQTEFGKPFSVKGLGNRISDWFRQAGLPHCTAHSVRKGLATDQAHNEATDSMLEAMFGWKDAKTSKIYTRNAERARLARQAVSKISWDGIGSKLLAFDG